VVTREAALGSMSSMKQRGELLRERMRSPIDLLAEPGASLHGRVRAAMAACGLSFSWMFFQDQTDDLGELRDVVLAVGRELIGCVAQPGPAGPAAFAGPAAAPAARTRGSTR
jgi:hypothetical protein